jgi:hypothetical protein
MLKGTPSPSDASAVKDILDQLNKKKPGDLRQVIREQIRITRDWVKDWEAGPFDFSHLKRIREVAGPAHIAVDRLIREAREVGLLRDPFPATPLLDALRTVELWRSMTALRSRMDVRQWAAARAAIVIIEECSDDRPESTEAGNLHLIARAIYQEIWGQLRNDKQGTALLKACRKALEGEQLPGVHIG